MLFGGGPEGRISHKALKANRNWDGVRMPYSHLDIKAEILLGTNFFCVS